MVAVLDPTALTGFRNGLFAVSAQDDEIYLIADDGAIPLLGARDRLTLDDAQLTPIGADWFELGDGELFATAPASPASVGSYAIEGRAIGTHHGESETMLLGITVGLGYGVRNLSAKPAQYFTDVPIPLGSSMTAIEAALVENADIANAGVYYVKPSTGSDGNDGSEGSPFATVSKAMRTATGAASRVAMLEDCVIEPFDLRANDASQTTAQLKWLDANGYDVTIRVSGPALSAQTWTQDGTYTNCYKATLSVGTNGQVTRVLNTATADDYGYDTPLRKYASESALNGGSDAGWYWDNTGKVLWVNIGADFEAAKADYRALYLNSGGTSRIFVYGAALGLSGIKLEGVQVVVRDNSGRRPEVWMHDCDSLYPTATGVDVIGWAVMTQNFHYGSENDACNGFQASAVGDSLIQAVNSQFVRAGDRRTYDLNGTKQGISAHGGCNRISFGCSYVECNGQGTADTTTNLLNNRSWLRGDSVTGGAADVISHNYAFGGSTTGSREVWMDSCTSTDPGGNDLQINADATVHTLNTTFASVSGTPVPY